MDGRALFRIRERLGVTQGVLGQVLFCDAVTVHHHEHEPNFGDAPNRRPIVQYRAGVAEALERALARHTLDAVWPRVNLAQIDRVALILVLGAKDPQRLRELLNVELLPPPTSRDPRTLLPIKPHKP